MSWVTMFNLYILDYDASEEEREEVLAEMFLDLDGDQDGLIDIDELSYDMATVLKGETRTPEDIMEETDTNRDGFIDYDGGLLEVSFRLQILKQDSASDSFHYI